METKNFEIKTTGIAKSYQKLSYLHRDKSNKIRGMIFRWEGWVCEYCKKEGIYI